ncbi:glycoside hydrolase family 15 protein [Mycetocola miduiensis]|uniref:Glucoamylase (Glucan-1,4-alpha-glucosidase), GH15 family n=1 Tax=Mycetocola miduiensis TaxID=995034 RepID=A0A1I5CR84_9MICO|nr:glycoside hydrolase family 15 protein [Mycetocola miduiensis]SFN89462.1 Glucoamylase (glucan-1,4-alpha-glucosidase), GH15 family [Mycetocola miduiensis]
MTAAKKTTSVQEPDSTDRPYPIEDYALIGDLHTAALISRKGTLDWLCMPRFDSSSMFAALVGPEDAGHWTLAPRGKVTHTERAYLPGTFVLRTLWRTEEGEAEVIEFMPLHDQRANLVRRVRGLRGKVSFRQILRLRFDYSAAVPWIRQLPYDGGTALLATAGPDAVLIQGPRLRADGLRHIADFEVVEDQIVDLVLTWYKSYLEPPEPTDVDGALRRTVGWWEDWARRSNPPAPFDEQVQRSLLVLRALTHEDTGGIVAAATMSLPEEDGGVRNWDYRYVWLRDAALTIGVLMTHGYRDEAEEWRQWLLRAIAGDPADVQIMYALGGERRLPEFEVPQLSGYGGAVPVRVGNAAYLQRQWDIFGEVMVALHGARTAGLEESEASWPLQLALLKFLEENWHKPDRGIWEIRGEERYFTHSRAMVWAAFDRGVRGITEFGLPGDAERWASLRDQVYEEIMARGFDAERNTFVQHYDTGAVDAALLQLPQIGFLEPDDPRMLGTVAALEDELMVDGLLLRYRAETGVDGLAGTEHPFLACSFWLVEQYAASGRVLDARKLMGQLTTLVNDLGLLSEEYDPVRRLQVGNIPQALSHLSLVRAADAIAAAEKGQEQELPLVRGESEGDQAAAANETGDEELPAATGETTSKT